MGISSVVTSSSSQKRGEYCSTICRSAAKFDRFSKHRNLERARRLVYAGRGQDDDGERRELRPGLELVQEHLSVHDRHHQVEQDQRRPWTSFQTFERGAPVGGFLDAVALLLEALADGPPRIAIVVDDEHERLETHVRPSRGRRTGVCSLHGDDRLAAYYVRDGFERPIVKTGDELAKRLQLHARRRRDVPRVKDTPKALGLGPKLTRPRAVRYPFERERDGPQHLLDERSR